MYTRHIQLAVQFSHDGGMTKNDSQPVALVIGAGSSRIGNCVARTLAESDYQVAIHANATISEAEQTAKLLSDDGRSAVAVQADITDEDDVKKMTAEVLDRFGHIEALVNCAGMWESAHLEDIKADDVRQHFDVNALGTFLCCQQVGLQMVSQDHGGAIVNVGDWAIARPYGDHAAYFPSKGAIPALTRTFAIELARRNPHVRVNAVLPGPVTLPEDIPEIRRRAAIAGTLVKREGDPSNVADAVLFLLRNDYVTGVCLPVDGGRSIYAE